MSLFNVNLEDNLVLDVMRKGLRLTVYLLVGSCFSTSNKIVPSNNDRL